MLSPSLKTILDDVFQEARSAGAESIGVERLLLALLGVSANPSARHLPRSIVAEERSNVREERSQLCR